MQKLQEFDGSLLDFQSSGSDENLKKLIESAGMISIAQKEAVHGGVA